MGARALFINPVFNKTESYGPFSKYITSQLPLSIGFVAGYLEEHNIKTRVLDEQLGQVTEAELEEVIREFDPHVVGFTVFTLTAARTYELLRLFKKRWPKIKRVVGGVHATLLPEEALKKEVADYVVREEGEITTLELFEAIYNDKSVDDIQGISHIRNGSIVHNPARPLIQDLDSLPFFPFHLFEKDIKRYQFGNMLTSRGCPYKCTFCSQQTISGRWYRMRTPEKVVEEMDILVKKYNQEFIFLNNDNFIVNKKKVYETCDLIEAKKWPKKVKIGCNVRGDSMDLDLLKRMKQNHFNTLLFGLETGVPRIMKMIKKGETVEEIERGIRIAKKAGMIISGQFIIGFPTETVEETKQTIRHAKKLPIDFTRFNLLVPYPGSEIYQTMDKSEVNVDEDWSNFASTSGMTDQTIPYIPKGRTAKDLLKLQWWGNLSFYMRPLQIFNIRKLKYGMAYQIVIPEPTSLKGCVELVSFGAKLFVHFAKSLLKKATRRRVVVTPKISLEESRRKKIEACA